MDAAFKTVLKFMSLIYVPHYIYKHKWMFREDARNVFLFFLNTCPNPNDDKHSRIVH